MIRTSQRMSLGQQTKFSESETLSTGRGTEVTSLRILLQYENTKIKSVARSYPGITATKNKVWEKYDTSIKPPNA